MRMAYSLLWRTLRLLQLHRLPGLFEVVFPNEIRRKVGAPAVVANELEPKYAMAWRRLRQMGVEPGDYLEFGVARGTSIACMHRVVTRLKLTKVRLFGFDAFDGLASTDKREPGSTIEETRQFLNRVNINWDKANLVEGRFNDTLNEETTRKFELKKASVVMMGCQSYQAVRAALDFSMPFIRDFTVIFFDDWHDDIAVDENRAFSEFLNENQHLKAKEFCAYRPNGRMFLIINMREDS